MTTNNVFERNLIHNVKQARERIASGRSAIDHLAEQTNRYAPDYIKQLQAEVRDKMAAAANASLQSAADSVARVAADAERKLAELQPSDAERAAAAAVLRPVLDSAASNPDALMRSYRRTYQDAASRAVLESAAETIGSDLLTGGAQVRFSEQWQRLQDELAPLQSDDERAARELSARADAGREYLANAAAVVNHEMDPQPGNVAAMMAVNRVTFAAQQFERTHAEDTA